MKNTTRNHHSHLPTANRWRLFVSKLSMWTRLSIPPSKRGQYCQDCQSRPLFVTRLTKFVSRLSKLWTKLTMFWTGLSKLWSTKCHSMVSCQPVCHSGLEGLWRGSLGGLGHVDRFLRLPHEIRASSSRQRRRRVGRDESGGRVGGRNAKGREAGQWQRRPG